MTASAGYLDQLRDLLSPLGPVVIRRMFGGAGIYVGGAFIGIVDADVLYLKADATTAPRFAAEGCGPFSYATKKGRVSVESFRRAPDRLFDDADAMLEWSRAALDVARLAATRRVTPPRGRRQSRKARRRANLR